MLNKDKSFKIIRQTQKDLTQYLELGVKNSPCVLYGTQDKPFVFICDEEKCDYNYIVTHNIPYLRLNNAKGSTIVCSKGDVELGFFGDTEFCSWAFDIIKEEFSKVINGGKFINNDFVYNGEKYGAATGINFGDIYYIGVHISNEIDKDLIQKVCKKKSVKVPEKLPMPIREDYIREIFINRGGEDVL